jgi:hypothetical protein
LFTTTLGALPDSLEHGLFHNMLIHILQKVLHQIPTIIVHEKKTGHQHMEWTLETEMNQSLIYMLLDITKSSHYLGLFD